MYTSYSLNGAWEMDYQEMNYKSTESPFYNKNWDESTKAKHLVLNAIPGYWEDMTEIFQLMPFFSKLKINPEYGIQQYPMSDSVPDMALPNILGNFFYRRVFFWENVNDTVTIYFEGVQNSVSIWINNTFIGRHEGYSTPFELEILDGILKDGENTIVLSVSNQRLEGYCGEPVSGLTSRAANECTGGVTGTVELRAYNCPLRDVAIFISEDCQEAQVKVEAVDKVNLKWAVYDGQKVVKEGECVGDFTFDTTDLECWSPENPKLYDLRIICEKEVLLRTFGVRRLIVDGVHFKLNHIPYFLRGVCEHCYFPETIHPNHDRAYYRNIIKTLKKLGFNFIRFHTYIPEEEYMQAADELGMLLHVECPNNTSLSEWVEIVKFCRRHSSVVIYCCGNELLMDESFITYLEECANIVHTGTDALFSPLSALRGLEYAWTLEPGIEAETVDEPFRHHPGRFRLAGEFSDMYSSYANGLLSYYSLDANPEKVDEWSKVYQKPRVSHEICIDGTYTDLSLKDRYKGSRVARTDMFTSIERHLEAKGVLKKAPLYFKNSCEWQRRLRKYCFEAARRSNNLAGYDFLGPIDTHWHTFGYDVGMMNEFYELKPGETVRNVLMYNSATVLLTDLGRKVNFTAGERLSFGVSISHYGSRDLENAQLKIRLLEQGRVIASEETVTDEVKNGRVSKLHDFAYRLPEVEKPCAMKLYITLESAELFVENEWEIYLFPKMNIPDRKDIVISEDMKIEELVEAMKAGRDVLLLGGDPFACLATSFRIALAGRPSGNLATVIADHPLLRELPHDGFCGWQFGELLENGRAVCFESDDIPFEPIIEVVSTHKYVIRQAALFEFRVLNGRLLVCSFNLQDGDPAATWLLNTMISYMQGEEFVPRNMLNEQQLYSLAKGIAKSAEKNQNLAFNVNDKTAVRRRKN